MEKITFTAFLVCYSACIGSMWFYKPFSIYSILIVFGLGAISIIIQIMEAYAEKLIESIKK